MKRLFRWGYVLPRLAAVFVLLCLSEFGAAWLVRHTVRTTGQTAVGARVDIAHSKASLLSTKVALRGVQVANPEKPLTNLVEADAIELDFDAGSLLRKKAVVTKGTIRGLRFGSPRVASGELPDAEPREPGTRFRLDDSGLAQASAARAEAWLDQLGERLETDVKDQFESVKVARQLREKWPAKYDELTTMAEQLEADAKQLKDQVDDARKNPLRHATFLQSVPNRLSTLQKRLQDLRRQLAILPEQVRSDRQAIAVARQHDEQVIRQQLQFDNLDADSLSDYLLGEQIAGPLQELVAWVRWVREMTPSKKTTTTSERGRGVEVLFAGLKRRPNLLIESLDLSGAARIAGRPVELRGNLVNFTTEPRLLGKPTLLDLKTTGALPVELHAVFDRTGPVARDHLTGSCQGLLMPQLDLERQKWLGLTVAASSASLDLDLVLEGEQLSGHVALSQQRLRVAASEQSQDAKAPLRRALAANLNRMGRVETRIDLSGEIDRPNWKITSNLGPAVAEALQVALRDTVDQHTEQLLADSKREVDAQLQKFDQEIAAATARLTPALEGPGDLLQAIAGAAPTQAPLNQLGRRLTDAVKVLK